MLASFGILTPAEAFSEFDFDFIIMFASIFVVGAAMQKAGMLDILGHKLFTLINNRGKSPNQPPSNFIKPYQPKEL